MSTELKEGLKAAAAGGGKFIEAAKEWVTSGQALKDVFLPGPVLGLLNERSGMFLLSRATFYFMAAMSIGLLLEPGTAARNLITAGGLIYVLEEFIGTSLTLALVKKDKDG